MPTSAPPEKTLPPTDNPTRGSWRLWVFVVLMFLLLIYGWSTIIRIANANKPEEVPLEHQQAEPATP